MSTRRRMPTQRERVLRALRRAGDRGITAVDFSAPDVIDGYAPIMRVGSRIEELRRDGYRIVPAGWRQRCRVYRLAGEPDAGVAAVATRVAPAPVTDMSRARLAVFDEDMPWGGT